MSSITQTLSQLSDPPSRSDPSTFDDRADQFLSELPELQAEINTWTSQANVVGSEMSDYVQAAATSVAAANFAGSWSDLSGSLAVPSSVYHDGGYWMLLSDVADVTSSEPGVGIGWAAISTHTFTQTVEGQGQKIRNIRWQGTAEVVQDIGDVNGSAVINPMSGGVAAITVTGDVAISVTGWPESGVFGELLIEMTNGGLYTVTWPTVHWIMQDGATTTDPETAGWTLRAAGVDFVYLWTRDGGATIYGKVVR